MEQGLADSRDLLELAEMEEDEDTVAEVEKELAGLQGSLEKLEFRRMFSGEMDANNAYLDIQSGSGGTEAQDWANMLLRMYLRWAEHHGFKAEITELSAGEVAGIKSATVHIQGDHAFGWLRTETGVHRLRSEEHTSELQSRPHLVCRLLLEKKKQQSTEKKAGAATDNYAG